MAPRRRFDHLPTDLDVSSWRGPYRRRSNWHVSARQRGAQGDAAMGRTCQLSPPTTFDRDLRRTHDGQSRYRNLGLDLFIFSLDSQEKTLKSQVVLGNTMFMDYPCRPVSS